MGVTRLAINRPIAILMMVAAFLVLGIFSYYKLPAELNPKVDFPVVTITTSYAGTNPQEMETLITKPIEDSISGVSGLKQVNSTSQQGVSSIRCTFYFGTNLDQAAADVREKVDAVRRHLPTDADSPAVVKQDSSSQPVMYLAMKGNRSPRELRILADNVVSERLGQATDVAAVNVYGGEQREIRVSVKEAALAAYGITIGQLAQAIQNANSNLSAGYIQSDQQYASIRFLGELASVDEIKSLRLAVPSANASGSTAASGATSAGGGATTGSGGSTRVIRLADVADVQDTTVERTQESTLDGQDSVTLAIQKTSDGNTLNATDGVKRQMKDVKKFLPADVNFVVTRDDSINVRDNLKDVEVSLFLGALLATLIVFLFLHNLRATIIVALAIPTCLIATFLPLSAMGFTLNSMTLLGLSLAIGILIDDSIVVIENIVRHLSMGQEPTEAALMGRSEIGMAALTLTAVDLVVFVPIAFMGGVIGEFFRSFGVAISIAVLFSLFVSFTLTPMLSSRWFRKGEVLESSGQGRRGFFAAFDRGYHRLERGYESLLSRALRHPWLVFILGNVLLVVALVLIAPRLGFRFAPGQDQNQVAVIVETPAGSSLSYTKSVTDEVERRIRASKALKPDVQYLLTSVGRSQAGGAGAGNTGTQYGNIQVSLYEKAAPLDAIGLGGHHDTPLRRDADTDVAKIIRGLVKTIPGAKIQAAEVNGFGGGGAPLSIDVVGVDFNQLLMASNKIKDAISAMPGVYNTDLSFKASQPELQVRLDRVRAAEYGLNVQQVSQTVADAMQGNIGAKFRDPGDAEQYNIRVQLAYADRDSIYKVQQIPVAYQGGSPVLLGDVAQVSLGAGPTRVDRLNRLRQISVTGYLMPGTQIGNIRQKVDPQLKKMAAQGQFGQTSYQWGGEAQTLSDEGPYLASALVLGIILSYMLMAALFNNMLYPLSVMLTMPQALVGALLALLIAGQPLSLIAAIGIVMLNGIATKNAILMVDFTNTLRARGYKRLDAIREAAPTRLRPILMTSLCIIGATLPTALALGRGAGFRQPLGITVVGGVIVSTFLTLLVIPCSYLLFDNFSNWLGRRVWHKEIPAEALAYSGTDRDGDGRGRALPYDSSTQRLDAEEQEREPLD